jgi:hypothetical protein
MLPILHISSEYKAVLTSLDSRVTMHPSQKENISHLPTIKKGISAK